MSLWNYLFGGKREPMKGAPSSLRNKPGGLARVRLSGNRDDGSEALQNRFVTTVRLHTPVPGYWVIDPPLAFTLTRLAITSDGHVGGPGCGVIATALHDDVLEPIRDIGDDERDEAMDWLPTVPCETALQKELLP